MLVLWAEQMAKRPGWQTGAGLDMLTTWRERAESVRGRGLPCGHFIPEEAPEALVAELFAFLDEVG